MELLNDVCFWCENKLSRPSTNLLWIDDYESAECEFHPVAYDRKEMKRSGMTALHQTEEEVHKIIRTHHWNTKELREKKPLRLVEDNVVSIAKKAHRTSRMAAEKVLPRSGSIRQKIYEAIKFRGFEGMTDYELEKLVGGKHQTVSASRRSLVVDGFIIDSGQTRKNPEGNECIVWVEVDTHFFSGVLFNEIPN